MKFKVNIQVNLYDENDNFIETFSEFEEKELVNAKVLLEQLQKAFAVGYKDGYAQKEIK